MQHSSDLQNWASETIKANCKTSNLCVPDTSGILHTFAYYMFYLYVRWSVPFKAFGRAFCAIAGLGAKARPPTHKSGALARASSCLHWNILWTTSLYFRIFQISSSCSPRIFDSCYLNLFDVSLWFNDFFKRSCLWNPQSIIYSNHLGSSKERCETACVIGGLAAHWGSSGM